MVNYAVYLGNGLKEYSKEILRSRRLIVDLTRREFRGRYLGSAFGFIWAFVQPAIMMLIYWVVFRHFIPGAGPIGGAPFVVWLLAGLVPWFFLSDCLSTGSTVVIDNRFLVKKVVFRVSLLPVVRLLSGLPVHLFFLGAISIIFWSYGYPPTWQSIQILYYLVAAMLFGLGFTWLVSALVPFLKDLSQVVTALLQIFLWLTPIMWSVDNTVISTRTRWILTLNPFYYVVRGYRESMVNHVWFWHHPLASLYYWGVTTFFLLIGGIVFLRLRPHFADVL